jgi:hypothetical protein
MFFKISVADVMAAAVRAAGLRFALIIGLALIAVTGPARAEQKSAEPSPAAVKLAREIIELKDANVLFGPMVPGVIERVKSMFLQTSPTLGKDLEAVAATLRKTYASRTNDLLNDVAWVYASRFTEAELKEIVTFYRSPTGKKVIQWEPQVFEDAMSGLKAWQDTFSEEVIGRFRADMKKRGHDL